MKKITNSVILIVVLILAIVVLLSYLLLKPKSNIKPIQTPTPVHTFYPSPGIQNRPEQGQSYNIITPDFVQQIQKDSAVTQLINKVPIKSQNFTLDYEPKNYQFILSIDSSNKQAGETEFDNFLKQNNIQNRSWFKNLVVIYQ